MCKKKKKKFYRRNKKNILGNYEFIRQEIVLILRLLKMKMKKCFNSLGDFMFFLFLLV